MLLMFDSMANYNQGQCMKCITTDGQCPVATKATKMFVYVSVDEDSLRQRKGPNRPGVSFDLVETLQITTASDLATALPVTRRKN